MLKLIILCDDELFLFPKISPEASSSPSSSKTPKAHFDWIRGGYQSSRIILENRIVYIYRLTTPPPPMDDGKTAVTAHLSTVALIA